MLSCSSRTFSRVRISLSDACDQVIPVRCVAVPPRVVAVGARRFLGHRQDDVEVGHVLARRLLGRHEPHQRVAVCDSCIVHRHDRDALGLEQSASRVPRQGLVRERRRVARHVQALESLARQQLCAVERFGVRPEIRLGAHGRVEARAVDRSRRVTHGLVAKAHDRVVHDDRLAGRGAAHDLRVDHVVGRQDREHREVGVHAVHAEVVRRQDLVDPGCCSTVEVRTVTGTLTVTLLSFTDTTARPALRP